VDKLLSLSMIVKNEEMFLADCLRSVEDLVDEMVIVDTGSTDRTIEIARSFGARVIEIEWPHDFSKARNVGLDAISTPWVLIMDADEELVRDDMESLREALVHPVADAYNIRIISLMDRAEDITESYVTRVLRSDPRIRFRGEIHEQLFQALVDAGLTLTQLDVRLTHKGYLNSIIQGRDKQERNRIMLEEQLKKNPSDIYTLWQTAQTYLSIGRSEAALDTVRRALKFAKADNPLWVLCMMTYVRVLLTMNQPKKAVRVLREGEDMYPRYTDFWYLHATVLFNRQDFRGAEKYFQRCLEIGEAQGFLTTDTGIGGFKSLYRIAQCHMMQGDPKTAVAYLLLTIKSQPQYRSAWRGIFEVLAGSAMRDVLKTIALKVDPPSIVATLSSWNDLDENERNLLLSAQEVLGTQLTLPN